MGDRLRGGVLTDWHAVVDDIRDRQLTRTFTKMDASRWDPGRSQSIPVFFRNKQYPSASSALEDYIWEHEGRPSKKFTGVTSQDVLELLSPRELSNLKNPINRSSLAGRLRQEAWADEIRELGSFHKGGHEVRRAKESVSSLSSGTAGRQEEVLPSASALYKVDSTSTDLLIAADPYLESAPPRLSQSLQSTRQSHDEELANEQSHLSLSQLGHARGQGTRDNVGHADEKKFITNNIYIQHSDGTTRTTFNGSSLEHQVFSHGNSYAKETSSHHIRDHDRSSLSSLDVSHEGYNAGRTVPSHVGNYGKSSFEMGQISDIKHQHVPYSNSNASMDKSEIGYLHAKLNPDIVAHSDSRHGNQGKQRVSHEKKYHEPTVKITNTGHAANVRPSIQHKRAVSSTGKEHARLDLGMPQAHGTPTKTSVKRTTSFPVTPTLQEHSRLKLGKPQAQSSRHNTPARPSVSKTGESASFGSPRKHLSFSHVDKTNQTYSDTIVKAPPDDTRSVASLPGSEGSSEIVPTKKRVNFTDVEPASTFHESSIPSIHGNMSHSATMDPSNTVSGTTSRTHLSLTGTDYTSNSLENCAKYQDFASNLLKEVEDSASSIVSPEMHPGRSGVDMSTLSVGGLGSHVKEGSPDTVDLITTTTHGLVTPDVSAIHMHDMVERSHVGQGDQTDASDPGFLARVQQLLDTPSLRRPLGTEGDTPSLRRHLGVEAGGVRPGSPGTDSLLDGDRSWEQYLPVSGDSLAGCNTKPPVHVSLQHKGSGSDEDPEASFILKANRITDEFKQQCLAEAAETSAELPSLSGGEHPGTMETLKHMIFNLQSFDMSKSEGIEEEDSNGEQAEEDSCQAEGGAGEETLDRAMVHLGRLKSLIKKDKRKGRRQQRQQ